MKLLYTESTEHLIDIDVNKIIDKAKEEIRRDWDTTADNDSLYDYILDNLISILEELYPELEGQEYKTGYIESEIEKILF